MRQKRYFVRGILILVGIFLLAGATFAAECTPPVLEDIDTLVMADDRNFYKEFQAKDINYPDELRFSWSPIDFTLLGFSINLAGVLNFTPTEQDIGEHTIILFVVNPEDCVDYQVVDIVVEDAPEIRVLEPGYITPEIAEGDILLFNVTADDADEEEIQYLWYIDSNLSGELREYYYTPDFESEGVHVVNVTAIDSDGYSASYAWSVNVTNTNRRPVLKRWIPRQMWAQNTNNERILLGQYFIDPDHDELTFDYHFLADFENSTTYPDYKMKVSIEVGGQSRVMIEPLDDWYGTRNIVFTAQDSHGANRSSNVVLLEVVRIREEVTRINVDPNCVENWVCDAWSDCFPAGIKLRKCTDVSNCGSYNNKPPELTECIYTGSCNDSILNQGETDIDCGGPCPACPNCTDGIQNQGEEGVDCGGPCDAICPTCDDGIQNQNETGVDCGGQCEPCPTCDDGIQNQGEEGIDCGGPCVACPSCHDGLKNQDETDVDCGGTLCGKCTPGSACYQDKDCVTYWCVDSVCREATCDDGKRNQGEESVDCGGPCDPCPTCDDGIQNQGEEGKDCGGPCSRICYFKEIWAHRLYLFIALGVALVVLGVIFLRRVSFRFKFLHVIPKLGGNQALKEATEKALADSEKLQDSLSAISEQEAYSQFATLVKGYFSQVFHVSADIPGYEKMEAAIRTGQGGFLIKRLAVSFLEKLNEMDYQERLTSIQMYEALSLFTDTLEEMKRRF